MIRNTSWGAFSSWYNELIEKEKNNYQKKLILPNLIRLLGIKRNNLILDIACGQGFFCREFSKLGASVIGVDVSKELIGLAIKHVSSQISYHVSTGDNMPFIKNSSIDKIVLILAIQNIENISDVFKECNRILKSNGEIYIVLNHPVFRIPKETSWGWDEKRKVQYRRIDSYLSESRAKIQMHPGKNLNEYTWSFHRPLQFYSKIFSQNNFSINRIEEWDSHKKSEPGPKAIEENRARKEIPLFMFIQLSRNPRS